MLLYSVYGGVGSYTVEALARSGIGNITLVDNDIVDITNINRQLIADITTIGKNKVDVSKERLLKINPNIKVTTYKLFYDEGKNEEIFSTHYDYIVDAIDSIAAKIGLIKTSNLKKIPIISCMGTGNKLDPTKFEVTDISKTSVCPLAKVIRKQLKKNGIEHLKVIYSKENPKRFDNDNNTKVPSSISFVPSVAGLILAGEVIKDLLQL